MESVEFASCFLPGAGTANVPLFRIPAGHGGITLVRAYISSNTNATIGAGQLNNNGTALGTAISATVGTLAVTSGTLVANVQKEITISTAYQAENTWMAWQCVTGISGTGSIICLEYKYGK
jgi:hypothetical protein